MKKPLLLLCAAICLVLLFAAFWPMQSLPYSAIPIVSEEKIASIMSERSAFPTGLLSLKACGDFLPRDAETDTLYTPKLSDAITAFVPYGVSIIRTENQDGACTLLLYSAFGYTEYRLVETNLPVISIDLSRFDLDAHYISYERIRATAHILFTSEDGSLSLQTENIEIKQRGGSSTMYPKKSYTLFCEGTSEQDNLCSPLGLPADRKFALNSLYEDDSKIRDALAYRLWEQIEPDNALRFTYTEVIINNQYCGLYGLHGLPTESSLSCSKNDFVYKINKDLYMDPNQYREEFLPRYEVAAGDTNTAPSLAAFLKPFTKEVTDFPSIYDLENFTNFSVLMEVLACEDTSLKNMLIILRSSTGQYRLTGWDMDQSFGNVWNDQPPLYVGSDASLAQSRYLAPSTEMLKPLSILYASCPDFADAVAERYRELRQTIFTDEALLSEANALYDRLTDCGARARDAARWPDGATSEDNSFIEAFIPEHMIFLDKEFRFGA